MSGCRSPATAACAWSKWWVDRPSRRPPAPVAVKELPPKKDGTPHEVKTRSPMVKKAREGVMEFLLINHPLDCPICDQGGECDLQDQAMAYGADASRFAENKRAVEDKYIGPLVKTVMTRCIQCTRCIRFSTEVAGVPELGAIGRGEDMEITTYLEHAMTSELQSNVVDLCPVGALTSKPYAFSARSWELTKTQSIDVMDALGSAIRIDTRGREVMRILPRANDDVNEEWISDKARHVVDGLRTQRLDQPYIRVNGRLRPATWREAFVAIAEKLRPVDSARVGALAGQLAAVEEMFALKALMTALGVRNIDARYPGSPLHPKHGRASYLFNSTIAGIDQADAMHVRSAPIRAKKRRCSMRASASAICKGDVARRSDRREGRSDLSLDYLGRRPGEPGAIRSTMPRLKAERPMFIIGSGRARRGPMAPPSLRYGRQGRAVARRRQGRLERL